MKPETAKRTSLLVPSVLTLLVVLVYGPGAFGQFVWDDPQLIVDDTRGVWELLSGPFWAGDEVSAAARSLYRPVVSVALRLQMSLFGADPVGFHLVSLALHAACVLLCFRWLRRRLEQSTPSPEIAAAIGAALFALHPSRPETVTWISGSTDLWMALGCFLALEAWSRPSRSARIGGAIIGGGLALLSKETAVVLPALLAADALLQPGGVKKLKEAALVAAGMAVILLGRFLVVPLATRAGAVTEPFVPRVLSSLGTYVARVIWPWTPSVMIGVPDPTRETAWIFPPATIALGAGLVLMIGGLCLLAWRRQELRPWCADALWFVLPLLPVSNILPLDYRSLVADRFLYLPLLGVSALFARGVGLALGRTDWVRPVTVGAGAVLAGSFAWLSAGHVGHWLNETELWTWERSLRPNDARVAKSLGSALENEGKIREAGKLYATALSEAPPAWKIVRSRLAVMYLRTELALLPDAEQDRLGSIREALDGLASAETKSVQLAVDGDPVVIELGPDVHANLSKYRPLHDQRAIAHVRSLDLAGAETLFREQSEATPDDPHFVLNLALAFAWQERWADAIREVDAGLVRLPGERGLLSLRNTCALGTRLDSITDPAERAIARAKLLVTLHAKESARRVLREAIEVNGERAELCAAAIEVDIADRAWSLARDGLAKARAAHPDGAARWDLLAAKLMAAEGRATLAER